MFLKFYNVATVGDLKKTQKIHKRFEIVKVDMLNKYRQMTSPGRYNKGRLILICFTYSCPLHF